MHTFKRNQIAYIFLSEKPSIVSLDVLTSIDEENSGQQAGDLGSVAEFLADRTDRSEKLGKAQRLGDNNNPESEKSTSVHLQGRHEVQNQCKACHLYHNNWDIRDGVCDAKGRGTVEPKALLSRKNRSAHERSSCLRHTFKEEIKDWEEENTWTHEDRTAVFSKVVEEGTTNQSLKNGRADFDDEGEFVTPHNLELSKSTGADLIP